jgi:hypothetical protein
MKLGLTIVLILTIITQSCNRSNSISTEQDVIDNDETDSTEANYVNLNPIDTIDGNLIYDIHGFEFTSPENWTIQESLGPDFSVTSFKSQNGQRFGCYFGWHPSYPEPIKWQMSKWSNQTIQKELLNTGYYIEVVKVSIENGIDMDSSIIYKTDSMYLEVYRLETKDLWIRKPLKKRIGPIDIAVDFHADSVRTMLHFMGDSETDEDSDGLIKLAKSVEKL